MTMWPATDRPSCAHRLPLAILLSLLLCVPIAVSAQDATVTPPADAPQLSLTFTELNDSGVAGVVTLYGDGEQTIVEIRVENAGPDHPAHIHQGSCDDLEPEPAFPLENVKDGRSTSVVDASLDKLLSGDYAIDLHLSVNELGTLVVCTPIEGEPTGGGSEPTPEPTATATEAAEETPDAVGGIGDAGDGTGGARMISEDIASLPLPEYEGSGVTGIVAISAVSDTQTSLIVQLSGDPVVGGHIVHLHTGTSCDDLEDEGTIDLESIDEMGYSESTVDIPFDDLLNGDYAINIHASEEDYDTWFSCAMFADATVGTVVPEVAPPTGSGPATPTPDATAAPVETLPQQAGAGFGIALPGNGNAAILWAMATGGTILALSAVAIRRGERGNRPVTRWRRLGL